jgi:hypothetical protein
VEDHHPSSSNNHLFFDANEEDRDGLMNSGIVWKGARTPLLAVTKLLTNHPKGRPSLNPKQCFETSLDDASFDSENTATTVVQPIPPNLTGYQTGWINTRRSQELRTLKPGCRRLDDEQSIQTGIS